MATRGEIRAVRRVLYDRERVRRLFDHMNSIVILMNFDPEQEIAPDDPRERPGAGPIWFVPATGEVSPAVLESADRCEEIARILMTTRRELGEVDFDRSDKRHLREGLAQQARAWRTRAAVWRDPGAPDPESAAAAIVDHERRSLRELREVRRYLKRVRPP